MPIRSKPKVPTQRALTLGEPFDDTDLDCQWIERGNIVAVNPPTCTCDVETETRGRFNGIPFPYLVQDSEGGGGHVYVPRPGQQVIVQQGLGTPFITQILPVSTGVNASAGAAGALTASATFSAGGSAAFSPSAAADYSARLPKDLLPGDFMWLGNQGQHLAVLDGGVVAMSADPWSQISCTPEDDTTTIIGRNLNIATGFGNIRFFDEEGKSGMAFEGGTDQTLESGFGRENWTVQARVGGDAEGFADFRINNREGEALAKTIWGADGSVNILCSGDQQQQCDGSVELACGGNASRTVGGADTVVVNQNRTESFSGTQNTTVSQNRICNVLNDRADIISRDHSVDVGRIHKLTVSGNPLAIPPNTSVAAPWSIANGSWIVDVGFPGIDQAICESHIEFNTYAPKGKIQLSSLLDKVILDTYIPDSVLLGSTMGVAIHHAVNWEPLEAFLKQLISWAQNHIHPTGVGPSGPATVPFPAQSILEPLLVPCKNLKVMLGL